ncbi:protein HIRA [Striga asiatica]|uniref:Protein HIRA n=1 Tax=Striga asiatica TaxID=4170 RepID=A0A5A7Q1E6_STRAF|nr:protein HIRA [Striga asiatica]
MSSTNSAFDRVTSEEVKPEFKASTSFTEPMEHLTVDQPFVFAIPRAHLTANGLASHIAKNIIPGLLEKSNKHQYQIEQYKLKNAEMEARGNEQDTYGWCSLKYRYVMAERRQERLKFNPFHLHSRATRPRPRARSQISFSYRLIQDLLLRLPPPDISQRLPDLHAHPLASNNGLSLQLNAPSATKQQMIAEKPSWIRHCDTHILSNDIQPGGLRFATGGGLHLQHEICWQGTSKSSTRHPNSLQLCVTISAPLIVLDGPSMACILHLYMTIKLFSSRKPSSRTTEFGHVLAAIKQKPYRTPCEHVSS